MSHPFTFRPGTWDQSIFDSVCVRNEYHLPDRFEPDDVIVDIGAHIGSFCYAALQRGANHVLGFEANRDNYEAAERNLRAFGARVQLRNMAVWRSDRHVPMLRLSPNPDNNAAGHVLLASGTQEVAALPFDDVINQATGYGQQRIRLLKMDCEGSEFPILLTSSTLHLIDEVVGEYHEYGLGDAPHHIPEGAQVAGYARFTFRDLARAVRAAGFKITAVRPHPDPNTPTGVFWARATFLRYPIGFWRTKLRLMRQRSRDRLAAG